MGKTAEVWGCVGLPAPVRELAAQTWDVIIVGAGHNGLTCTSYLARVGKRVLVLEARERVGGAFTLADALAGFSCVALRVFGGPAASSGYIRVGSG